MRLQFHPTEDYLSAQQADNLISVHYEQFFLIHKNGQNSSSTIPYQARKKTYAISYC